MSLDPKTLLSLRKLSTLDTQSLVSLLFEIFRLDAVDDEVDGVVDESAPEVAKSAPATSAYPLTETAAKVLDAPSKDKDSSVLGLDVDRRTLECFRERVRISYHEAGVKGMLKMLKDEFVIVPVDTVD
ncbi:hypothetical protein NHQ30_000390 [Ciborinia camelliae]|nr:hypothetical protein NHQ30_000390 [Ciborinia camelliae]